MLFLFLQGARDLLGRILLFQSYLHSFLSGAFLAQLLVAL